MEKTNKNAIFCLLFGLRDFSQLCHKNKWLDAFLAFWDALASWKKTPVIYFNYLPPALRYEHHMVFAFPSRVFQTLVRLHGLLLS
jgi:hypothetical protein